MMCFDGRNRGVSAVLVAVLAMTFCMGSPCGGDDDFAPQTDHSSGHDDVAAGDVPGPDAADDAAAAEVYNPCVGLFGLTWCTFYLRGERSLSSCGGDSAYCCILQGADLPLECCCPDPDTCGHRVPFGIPEGDCREGPNGIEMPCTVSQDCPADKPFCCRKGSEDPAADPALRMTVCAGHALMDWTCAVP
jgi:hypothetical protein